MIIQLSAAKRDTVSYITIAFRNHKHDAKSLTAFSFALQSTMLELINSWLAGIQRDYGVNPLIFGVIYCVCVVPFWLSIYKIIAGIKSKKTGQVSTFAIILGITIIAPFVYVAFFGRNLPFWFWIIALVVITYSTYSVLRRIKIARSKSKFASHNDR